MCIRDSSYIFPKGKGEKCKILKNYGKKIHVLIIPVLTDIDPIEGNCPFGRVIEAAKQLDPVSYTHLDVYKRQIQEWEAFQQQLIQEGIDGVEAAMTQRYQAAGFFLEE